MRSSFLGKQISDRLQDVGCQLDMMSLCRRMKVQALKNNDVAIVGDPFDRDGVHLSAREELCRFVSDGKGVVILGHDTVVHDEYFMPVQIRRGQDRNGEMDRVSISDLKEG